MSDFEKRIIIADLDHQEQNALDELVLQWRAKRRRNALRAGFYDMKNATKHLMSSNAPPSVKKRRFVLGWTALAVDKLARRCNLEGFYDRGGNDLGSLGLDEVVRDNRLLSEMNQWGVSGLVHSVSWIVTTQGDEEAGEPPVLMTGRDALSGTGTWDGRRRAIDKFLSLTDFNDDGEPVGMVMYLPNLIVEMVKESGRWTVFRRPHAFGVPVDPLKYKPRLGRPFGASRITRSAMAIHEQAVAAMIRGDVNGEAYSLPRYALLGATESAFQNADGTPKATWKAAWDSVWAIGDDDEQDDPRLARADIKQFHGQSPEPQNAHLRMLAQLFSGETSISLGELGIIGDSNPTSAEALTASRDDIIATAEQTTDDWSPDISSAGTRALSMLNGELPSNLDLAPRWRPPQHLSRSAAADAGSKVLDKAPWMAETEVGLELLGLRSDQIRRALNDRRRASGRELLNRLAERRESTGGNPA